MNIAIVGYGKMGKAVEKAALERQHTITTVIDPSFAKASEDKSEDKQRYTAGELTVDALRNTEVVIDFTNPESALPNIEIYAAAKVNAIIGTTGWYDQLPKVEKIVKGSGIGLLYAGNFSVGVQLFYQIVAEAAQKFAKVSGFDVGISEIHHTGKLDAPSGTSREIAEHVLANFPGKKRVLLDNAEQPVPSDALQISSQRIGKVVGVHTVTFDGLSDTITLTHTGKNRDGYATGSVLAAEWIKGKQGLFTAKDWL